MMLPLPPNVTNHNLTHSLTHQPTLPLPSPLSPFPFPLADFSFEITSALSMGMPETIVRTRVRPTNLPPGGPMWVEFVFKVKDGGIRSFEPVLDDNGWVRAPKSGGRV